MSVGEPVHRLLERNARKYPNEVAVRWPQGDVSITWPELNAGATPWPTACGQGVSRPVTGRPSSFPTGRSLSPLTSEFSRPGAWSSH